MANKKISQLTAASALTGTEELPIVQSGQTVKTTAQDIADLAGGGASYLKYTAVLGQLGINPPQVIVLENTIGNIVWTRNITGDYYGTLIGAFPQNKTWCSATSGANIGNTTVLFLTRDNDDTLRLQSKALFDGADQDINSDDGGNLVYECSIEIRVYP